MTTLPAFLRDAYLTRLATEVVATGEDGGRPWAALADTILYPEGGGQPADRGSLGDVEVLDVQKVAGTVRHTLTMPISPGPVIVHLDWARRFDHMQQHTAQHLVTAVAADRYGWPTTAFHLGAEVSDVELEVPALSPGDLARLEEAVAAEVRAARPVTVRLAGADDLASLGVRSRGLPPGHEGDVRLVAIDGVDLNTCGGTHVRSTAELEAVALLGVEPMRGGCRVHFVAGARLRARLAAHEARNAGLRRVLGSPDAEFVPVATLKLEQLRALEKRARTLEAELATAYAEALAARPEDVVEAHFADRDAGFLQTLGRAFAPRAGRRLGLFTAEDQQGACFLLAAGPACALDVPALGRRVAATLGGRGGGSGATFQGKVGSLAARSAALEVLRSGS